MSFHEIKELRKTFFQLPPRFAITIDIEVHVQLSQTKVTSEMGLYIFLMRTWRKLCWESPSTGSY